MLTQFITIWISSCLIFPIFFINLSTVIVLIWQHKISEFSFNQFSLVGFKIKSQYKFFNFEVIGQIIKIFQFLLKESQEIIRIGLIQDYSFHKEGFKFARYISPCKYIFIYKIIKNHQVMFS